jgi:S1-C subfamily serine protease
MSNTTPAAPEPAAPGPEPERQRRFPLGVAIACVVAGIALLVLLLPEVLLYPEAPPAPEPPNYEQELITLKAHNDALQDEVERMEQLLGAGICRVEDGTLTPTAPSGTTPPGTTPPGTTPPGTTPGTVPDPAQPAPAPGTAPTPAPAPGTQGSAPEILTPEQAGAVPLPALLDQSVALVIALYPNGQGYGTGSGFAVAPGRLATNRHVVEGAAELWVVNPALGGAQPAKLVAATPGSTLGEQDYALLAVEGGQALPPLAFAEQGAGPERLTGVVAAGFPGMLLSSDADYQRLVEGDGSAVPSLVLTQGIVTVVQAGGAVPLVVHSAQVSPGNSGGPLVDLCGRVVGINTFVQGDQTAAHVNYALSGGDLLGFLKANGVTPRSIAGACNPTAVTASTGEPD